MGSSRKKTNMGEGVWGYGIFRSAEEIARRISRGLGFRSKHLMEPCFVWNFQWNLVVKSKLPPRSCSSLVAFEPYPKKGAIKFKILKKKKKKKGKEKNLKIPRGFPKKYVLKAPPPLFCFFFSGITQSWFMCFTNFSRDI